jgi:hypothetical protein
VILNAPVVTYVVIEHFFKKQKTATHCWAAAFENGGPYWTRTSDLFDVNETL